MKNEEYELSCVLVGHEKDVRSLAVLEKPEGAFVSVSRDLTARVWAPNDKGYIEGLVMSGHENFVSCVCVLPPMDEHPDGLILTGSNDKRIHGYYIHSPVPLFKIDAHDDTVCSLIAGKFGSFVSCSWDKTAKVWFKEKQVMVLKGHEGAVWCGGMMHKKGLILTGSADKTIKIWKAGKVHKTLTGHTDCVRSLQILSESEFASAGNDQTIRIWDIDSGLKASVQAHSSFIYSLSLLDDSVLLSSGEDKSVKIWNINELKCIQTLIFPCQTVWSVIGLPNSDIAVATCDGVIRVFTKNINRIASPDVLEGYKQSVSLATIPDQIGDIKTEQLPGPEALQMPGKKEGQILMVRRPDKIEAYQWSGSQGDWIKVGDVTGGLKEGIKEDKKIYEGKEYDCVFDVEINEGQAPLKLPYNLSEDPYMAAHKFLEKNNLDPLFLDQVANFILKQTGNSSLGQKESSYVDPYTGGSRYLAGKGENSNNESSANNQNKTHFFPETKYIKFDQLNSKGLLVKLKEFNEKVSVESKLSSHEVLIIEKSLNSDFQDSDLITNLIFKLVNWPSDLLLPILDWLRYSVLNQRLNQLLFTNPKFQLLPLTESILTSSSKIPSSLTVNKLLFLRIIVNSLTHFHGNKMITENFEKILEYFQNLNMKNESKNIQIAFSSLFLNLSISLNSHPSLFSTKPNLFSFIHTFLPLITDPEAFFRCIVAIGTIISSDQLTLGVVRSLSLKEDISKHSIFLQSSSDPSNKITVSTNFLFQLI